MRVLGVLTVDSVLGSSDNSATLFAAKIWGPNSCNRRFVA